MEELTATYNDIVYFQIIPFILIVGLLGLVILVLRIKYEAKVEWYLLRFISRLLRKPPPPSKYDEEIVSEIKYDQMSREVRIISGNEDRLIITPKYDSQQEKLIRYLYKRPNRDVSLGELKKKVGLNAGANLSKIVARLNFTGEDRKLFFNVSKNTIRLTNPIRRKHIQ